MKYMLIMNAPRDGYAQFMRWPKELLQANMAFMRAFSQKLRESGEPVLTEALGAPTEAKLVRGDEAGRMITDGVFPESKEYLAGWWIVDVQSEARALAIAAEASHAPGMPITRADGTTIDHLWIEVRAVMGK